jgi:quinol monooxygenase YgiN
MSPLVKITAQLAAKPGRGDELRALLLAMAPLCRAEAGNLRWDIWKDDGQSDRYVLDELYVDAAAVVAHRETAHYKNYLLRIVDLADREALVLRPVAVEKAMSVCQ